MTPERWARAKTLFGAAMEMEPARRDEYLRATCEGDPELLAEVLSLLHADSADTVLHNPLARPASLGLLKNRYRLERELGRGGLGVVYLARDETLHDRPVVIKMPLDHSPGDPWLMDKFAAEVKALSLIEHPGVVGALDCGTTPDGRPFLVMQYLEGRSLQEFLQPEGVALPFAAEVLRQIGEALGAAHAKGIWHRDLKPPNIMLQTLERGQQHVRLIDFGIASVKPPETMDGETRVAGTPPYMAPEQLEGRVSAASDIFAMGVIAYELVTGSRPFPAPNMAALVRMHQAGVAQKPSQLRPGFPPEAERLIIQALSYSAEDRPRNAAEFGEALARALTTPPAAPAPPRPRTPVIAAAAAVIALCAGGALWKLWPGSGRDNLMWSLMVQPGRSGPAAPALPGVPLHTSDGFFLMLRARDGGYLYLLSDDPAADTLNYLGSFQLRAGEQNRIPPARPYIFEDKPEVLSFWCVWSREPVRELEALGRLNNSEDQGIVGDPAERARVRLFVATLPRAAPADGSGGSVSLHANQTQAAWKVRVEAK